MLRLYFAVILVSSLVYLHFLKKSFFIDERINDGHLIVI